MSDWSPPAGYERREVFGIAATTEPLADRGIRIARSALETVVRDFKPRPLRIEHGIERQGTILKFWLVDRDDGISELHYEGEVFLPPGVDPSTVVPRGMSITLIETERHSAESPVVVAGDSMTFDDEALEEARRIVADAPIEVAVERYHQFAVLPPPVIVVEIVKAAWTMGEALLAAATVEALKIAIRRLVSRSKQPTRPCRVSVRIPGAADVDVELPVNAEDAVEALDKVFEGVIGMVQAAASGAASTTPPDAPDAPDPGTPSR